jgi:hypothetical protein
MIIGCYAQVHAISENEVLLVLNLAPITAEQPDLFTASSVLIINKTELILVKNLHYLTPPFRCLHGINRPVVLTFTFSSLGVREPFHFLFLFEIRLCRTCASVGLAKLPFVALCSSSRSTRPAQRRALVPSLPYRTMVLTGGLTRAPGNFDWSDLFIRALI